MNKEYKIKLDLNKKIYNKKMAFNQFDENVNDFYIEVTKNNEVVKDLDKSIITLVAIKPNGEVDAQFIEAKEGRIYADLKPSMCDLVGNYQAKAMIVLEGEIVTTDTINYSVNEDKIISKLNDDIVSDERFTLFTDALSRLSTIETNEEQRVINEAERILSEENRKIEEAKRVEAELIRQHEEADRAKYDSTRESNENIRKQNESIRLTNETNRIDEETKRVEEENKRKLAEEERNANYNFMTEDEDRRRLEANAHKEAEVLRVQAETNRVNEEAKRRTTEQARVSAENTRVSNENTRKASEVTRQTNETQRVEAETQRKNRYNSFIADAEANANNFENYTNTAKVKEEERKSNELDRKSQEDRRVSNEVERISNENTRKANEKAREKNETSRQYVFENKVNEVDKKIVELNTTKDNFVSNINTKVDNKISEIDNVKDNFVSSISTKVDNKISELDSAKSDMTNTVSNKVNEVENRFNALTSKQQQNAEVIDARDGEISLKARLDRDIEKAKQVYVNVEGSHISTDSSVGYLKDVEILGNTIQDASNLADIRSVGDKVDGQELYEIPVLSCGKNLANPNNFEPSSYITSDGFGNYTIVKTGTGLFIPLLNNLNLKGSTYIIKVETLSGVYTGGNILFYGLDGIKFGEHTANGLNSTATITTTTGLNAIKLYGVNGNATFRIQISENNITEYEPYQEDKLTILSPVQLEKVGDVADRIVCKDGVLGVEKNVKTCTITGSLGENIAYSSTYDRIVFMDLSPRDNTISLSSSGTVTNFTWSSVLRLGIKNISDNGVTSIESARTWLQANPQLVKYIDNQSQFIPLPYDQQIKLRTFANKTNISFLTEIEGTIKAQVPKSLGATVNTHTEQINNLNKELDRVKKLEESTVSTVTTESGFTTVEQTTNGYFEDVKLEGKTLVNLCSTPNKTLVNTTEGRNLYFNIQMFKYDTDYTAIFNVGNVVDGASTIHIQWRDINGNSRFNIIDKNVSNVAGKYIVYKFKQTQIDTPLREVFLSINTSNPPTCTCEIKNMVVLEGDHTQNSPSYFEGLKSVGDATDEIVVESVNSDRTQSDKKRLLYYNEETQTWEKPILRQGDSIEKHANGKYYYHQRSGEIVFNGSENWNNDKNSSTMSPETYRQSIQFNAIDIPNAAFNTKTSPNIISDLLPTVIFGDVYSYNHIGISISGTDNIGTHIIINNNFIDVTELKQWLQANNLTVVYQLAQEKVYECTNIDLITYNGETNFIVESGVLSPKTTLKVHNNISNVVSLLQKKVSLLESNVTSYMITQNRLMLASRYNADTVSFKVDVASFSDTFEYDNDLYELILNNILVGKDNYNREYIENLTRFYWMDFVISDEMYSTLFELIEEQHNPKIEETPLI